MRKKLIIATTAGVLSLSGLAVAVPALADPGSGRGTVAVERITDALSGLVSDGSLTQEQADEVATTLSEAGLGRHGGHGGVLGLAAAATALDMTEEELRTAIEPEGTTLADVAEEQGVAVETLVAALVADAETRLADAVDDGRITQEEADERLADLEERISEQVTTARPDGPVGGHHHRHQHGD